MLFSYNILCKLVRPIIIFSLCISEEIAKRFNAEIIRVESFIDAMTYKVELSFYIVKSCVDRRGREHEYLHITAFLSRLIANERVDELLAELGALLLRRERPCRKPVLPRSAARFLLPAQDSTSTNSASTAGFTAP